MIDSPEKSQDIPVLDPELHSDRPWEQLEQLAAAGEAEPLEQYIDSLPSSEAARALNHLETEDQTRVLQTLHADDAADLLEELPDAAAADLIAALPAEDAAAILQELPSADQADLLTELEDKEAEAILAELAPAEAADLRTLASYDNDVAGGLMSTEVLSYSQDATVETVIRDLRRQADSIEDEQVQYVFLTDAEGRLSGVLRLRDLLFKPDARVVSSFMISDPLSVSAEMSLEELDDFFDDHDFVGAPVVDEDGRLLGVVTRAAVEEGVGERSESDHLKSQGIVGGEEFRSMPLRTRSTRRLSWLSINIVLNIVAASIIAIFQDTLSSVIALAVFLPIISDMSGCSGNQAIAVSMRELSLGLIKPNEVFYVWTKEIIVGIVNGIALGVLIGLVAYLWKGNIWLGAVVGGALGINTMIAVSIGGAVPLILKRFNMDPALASGPVLTTVTDMCGFLLTLGLATVMLSKITT